jgi:uncharacterized protein YabN with tetrapyrrole methylase and pyrophosphatase domain
MNMRRNEKRGLGLLHPQGRRQSPAEQRTERTFKIQARSKGETGSSLSLAYQLTRRAARLGFDWPDLDGVLKKFDEEMEEFREALSRQNRGSIREELGDLFFVLVNISRFLRINPEEALKKTVKKFIHRFHYVETSLHKKGKTFHQTNLVEMDRLWEEAKKKRTSGGRNDKKQR